MTSHLTIPYVVIGTPRSASTVFMHCLASALQLNGQRVKRSKEPFALSAYRGPEKRNNRLSPSIDPTLSYSGVFNNSVQQALTDMRQTESPSALVVKDIAFHIEPLFDTDWGQQFIRNARMVFITRAPSLGIPSLLRHKGWEDSCRAEQGYQILSRLFHLTKIWQGQTPFIFDGSAFQRDPDHILRALCEHFGDLKFDPRSKFYQAHDSTAEGDQFGQFFTEAAKHNQVHPYRPKPEDAEIRKRPEVQDDIAYAHPFYDGLSAYFA